MVAAGAATISCFLKKSL